MGYYDKGTYGKGAYNPEEERQGARDRYLDLLTKQRMNDQRMADKMRQEQESANKAVEEDEAGAMAVKGANTGMAVSGGNPYGALVGGLLGKGLGSFKYGQKHGALAGVGKFLDPRGEFNALTGSGSQGGAQGVTAANQVSRYQDERNKRAAMEELLREQDTRASNQRSGRWGGAGVSADYQNEKLGGINAPKSDLEASVYEADPGLDADEEDYYGPYTKR